MDLFNRDSFDEMIKISGNSLMLTSKLHVLLNVNICLQCTQQEQQEQQKSDWYSTAELNSCAKMQH